MRNHVTLTGAGAEKRPAIGELKQGQLAVILEGSAEAGIVIGLYTGDRTDRPAAADLSTGDTWSRSSTVRVRLLSKDEEFVTRAG